jgi:MoaA/NifB/PqqE/SkfB family radical SAM enzyme
MIDNDPNISLGVRQRKYEALSAMINSFLRNLDRGYISKQVMKKIVNSLVFGSFLTKDASKAAREEFKEKYGEDPPTFLVVSPTQQCNLKCIGCYAASGCNTNAKLPFDVLDKLVGESYNTFGDRFMTISGGEPFLYNDKGKTLFDIWEKYNDMFFLVYTNGTCISKDAAKRLAKLGNVTPAISVEGYEELTDERRGKGVFNRILNAFKNLREAGVPFGVSVTSTSRNADLLLKDEFYDYYFEKQGATYMWQFQLMPIGRATEGTDERALMISPEQRVKLYKKWKTLLEQKNYFIADFWNSGVLSNGCIAYGRDGGYFYVNWDGKINPCVFVPYYVDNIIDLYKNGKTAADALFSDLFRNGRKWQLKYSDPKNPHNWLMPCSMRDHYRNFRKNILTKDAKPENIEAEQALKSKDYFKMMDDFDNKLKLLTEDLWEEEYGWQKIAVAPMIKA